MVDFGRDLLKKIQGKDNENPLEIIGLSPAILEIGLTEDELYEYCRSVPKQLLLRVHPDLNRGTERPIAKKFTTALRRLNDPKVFKRALAEFRTHNAYRRRGEEILQGQIDVQKREIRQLQEEKASLLKEAKFATWVPRFLVGGALQFSSATETIGPLHACERLIAVSFDLEFSSAPPSKKRLSQAAIHYHEAARKSKKEREGEYGSFLEIINNDHLGAILLGDLLERARKSGHKYPVVEWDYNLALQELGFPRFTGRNRKKTAIRGASIRLSKSAASKYWEFIGELNQVLGHLYITRLAIVPKMLVVKNGFVSDDSGKEVRILGIANLHTALSLLPTVPIYQCGPAIRTDVIHETEPFVAAGKAVVSVGVPTPFKLRGDVKNGQDLLTRKTKEALSSKRFLFLSHVILEVPRQFSQ